MKIDSLVTKCLKFFIHNPEKQPSLKPYSEMFLIAFKNFLGQKNNGYNKLLIEKVNPSFEDIEIWKTSFLFFKSIGEEIPTHLVQLSLFYLDSKVERKLSKLLQSNKKLEVIDFQGIKLPSNFVSCCKELKFLKTLKLKQCSDFGFEKLLELFDGSIAPPVEDLALPTIDLNDEKFPRLLEKCGKKLKKIYLEHKGKEIVSQKTLKGKSIIKTSFSNSSDTVKADNLFQIGKYCPNLEAISLVNFQFSSVSDSRHESNLTSIWMKIFSPLTKLNHIVLRNYCKFDNTYDLSFLEKMDLSSWKHLVIERFPAAKRTLAVVRSKYPGLEIEIKDCD